MATGPVNLLDVSKDEFRDFLDSFDHIFSDCDGVIWSNTPLDGSGEFFKLMKKHGKTVHYVSNNSIRSKENYEAKFKASGITDGYENLTVPSVAMAEYLKSLNFNKTVYCVTNPQTIKTLESYGFKCKSGPDVGTSFYAEYVQYLNDDEEIGAVVFDSDFQANLPKMYKAITYLRRPEVIFLNGATDRHIVFKPGFLGLGTQVFTDLAIEETKRLPIQLGKPGKLFGEFAMRRADLSDPSRILFIGDMIEQDVGLGKQTGFKTLLVLTSHTTEEMLNHKTIQPDFYAPSLGSIVPLLN
ncbi:uncharacterized protein LOC131847404 [Achroia grisella]|uniref:uncharacterized protein LOC131847404 n=1 Tax=Achroia grisella TaxID=688607 RepID=UPI0027D255D8|nr:uncharacterized protein LOC131847404 [Achroia grisella]